MSLTILDQIVVHNFPQNQVSLIFGYGSRVIKQNTKHNPSDLVDIIIATDDPYEWHLENYKRNNQHYSFLKFLPDRIKRITSIQEKFGAGLYFNPYVRIGNLSVKYGVIKTEHLIEDLLSWNTLYVSGRLHKPVEFIVNTCDKNERLRSALRFNKESALRAALLLLPETFSSKELYHTITSLSYSGDLRMLFGEDVNKVENIVSAQFDRFNQLYLPIIKMNQHFKESVHWNESKHIFTQDSSSTATFKNLKLLPRDVRREICHIQGKRVGTSEADIVLASVSRSLNSDRIVAQALAAIVRQSSLSQSLKGIFTAGLVKSFKYSQSKLLKSFASRIKWII